ncbi:MAG: hypothetical protein K0S32_3546 [Bacteroidetes bacterium]|jgi:hypothetical protein|nr:hypothetical protein [Bacteroidota bacterium]
MEPKFNIDRPKISDEEINKHKDFNQLVKQFKQQSLKKARQDQSWWRNKRVRYSTVIAGATVVCIVTALSLLNNNKNNSTNETLTTSKQKSSQNKTNTQTAFVKSPSTKLAVPYSSYKIDNSKGGDIKHTTSSKIKVPKSTFVDKEGKDIVGEVVIEYREFHDKGDIIASGIPMAYDSAGKKYNLESAGMFDIRGTKDGIPVFIKDGKDLQVQLASASDENRFNQYYLDTIARNWSYIKHDDPVASSDKPIPDHGKQDAISSKEKTAALNSNPKLAGLKKDIEINIPKKIDSVKVVYTKKTEALPKPKEPSKPSKPTGRPTFLIDGSTTEFPELAAFDNVIFEVGSENTNYSKSLHDITWSDVKVSEGPQKGANYLLTLTYRKRVEKLIVYPVLSGADLEKAQKKYSQKFSEYEALTEKRIADEKKLMAEMEAKQKVYMAELKKKQEQYEKERSLALAKMQMQETNDLSNGFDKMNNQIRATRIFQVSKFGIYNSDCPHAMPDARPIEPMFVSDADGRSVKPDVIYLVDHSRNTVYNFYENDFKKISYNPSAINSFVVFSKNKMFLCSKDAFKATAESEAKKFTVKELPEGADNLPDFKKALEI